MKKTHILLILVVLLSLSMTTAAYAKQSGENLEGEVVEITYDESGEVCETLILLTKDGEETITLPEGFDCESFVGYPYVTVKGEWTINDDGNAELVLISFEPAEPEIEEGEGEEGEGEDGEDGEGEGWGKGGVYCAEDSGKTHPLVDKIAGKYEKVDSAWVMKMKCEGSGFGEIMLSIQTALAHQKHQKEEGIGEEGEGEPGDGGEGNENALGEAAEEFLNRRKAGQGWGQIWKDNSIVENENTDKPGNGRLNKPEKEKGPKEGKGPDKGLDHPSNKMKPDKENKNNKNKNDEDD